MAELEDENAKFFTELGDPTEETQKVYDILYEALSPNFEIDSEGYLTAAIAILGSDWLRLAYADAFDSGASTAGRFGHDDLWDNEMSPYAVNPWRTGEELIRRGFTPEGSS